jgi:fructosamine-3-kinase
MTLSYIQLFESICFETFGREIEVEDFSVVAAGLVNTGAFVKTKKADFFVKINEREEENFFQSEAQDLNLLSETVSVPKVFGNGKCLGFNYLITEFVVEAPFSKTTYELAGRQLAILHKKSHSQFGQDWTNFLASIPQDNQWKQDGINFLIQNRILPAVGLCLMEEKISFELYRKVESLCGKLGNWIPDEAPALIHGDLWSGNLMGSSSGIPYFIDPASSYGLRESELAITHLFGSFDPHFYGAYLEEFPLQPGFEDRFLIYHLHPLLVHLHLFGNSYLPAIERIVKVFLN